jgi:Tfp pilus assembly protein PilN
MINLLPLEEKRQIQAARTNVLLFRYALLTACVMVATGLMVGAGFVIMNTSKAEAEKKIALNASKASSYKSVQAEAETFRANLSTAKTILDKEVNYTKVILAIAQTLPADVTLDNLDLDANTFGTPFVLSAKAKSYDGGLALKSALEKSDVFSNVSLQGMTIAASDTGYPVSVQLNVTINKDVAK